MTTKDFEYKQANILKNKYECNVIFNNEEPFTLYRAIDVAKIINAANIRSLIINYDNSLKQKVSVKTNGGKQLVIYVTYNGLLRLLCKSKKLETKSVCKILGIDIYNHRFETIENTTIFSIMKAFECENMHTQYKIGSYIADLYFEDYKIIVECDEPHHNIQTNKINDADRETKIKQIIEGCVFVRYNPHFCDFNILNVINCIYKHIKKYDNKQKHCVFAPATSGAK
jgi:very-short-patch-repair endonuclease